MQHATENMPSRVLSPSVIKRTQSPEVPDVMETNLGLPKSGAPSDSITFVKRKGHYNPRNQPNLKNSLLAGVGFLELANAGDFAANVWNQVPIPPYAMALMAIGGTLALGIFYYAFNDARLSWINIRGLREERQYLRTQKAHFSQDRQIVRTLDSLLDVNFREIGTELVDRIGMDVFMGFGAVMVGIGTYMAIGGANHSVWLASNLLSGYIGNAPCALYGLINLMWSAYVWRRAYRHRIAGAEKLKGDNVGLMLENRTASVQLHAALNGITGTVAGAASLVTATRWWGYVILAPCIVLSILINYLWRHRIGYDRPFVRQVFKIDGVSLIEELKHVTSAQRVLGESPSAPLSRLISDPESIACVMEFITKNQLFEDFCMRLLQDAELSAALFGPSNKTMTIDSQSLLDVDDALIRRLLGIAQTSVIEGAPARFRYQERYLLETLGCCMCISDFKTATEKASESIARLV